MARTTPVSNGWINLTRPLGTILPVAEATISTCPKLAQVNARQNNTMSVAPMARPIGDGGVSTISSAAGRKASSSLSRRSRVNGKVTIFFVAVIAALADLIGVARIESRSVQTKPVFAA